MVHFSCQVLSMRENELLIEVKELTRIIGIENCVPIDCRAKLDDPYCSLLYTSDAADE